MSTILELTKEQQKIKDELFFEDDEQEIESLMIAFNQVSGTIENKIKLMIDIHFELELQAEARREVARVTQKRAITAENKAKRLKDFICEVMAEQELKRVDGVYRGFSRYQRETLVVNVDPDFLPDQYLRHKEPEINRSLLTQELKNGAIVDGCALVKVDTLRAI